MALEKDLLKAIRENMPEMVANDLAQYIDEAKQIAKDYETLKKNYETLFSDYKKLDGSYKALESSNIAMKVVYEAWERKSEDITKRECDLEVHDLRKDLACEQRANYIWEQVTGQFLRNTIYREEVQRSLVLKNADYKDYNTNTPLNGGDRTEIHTDVTTKSNLADAPEQK